MRKITLTITAELCTQLGITDSADDAAVGAAIVAIAKKAGTVDIVQAQLTKANADKTKAETDLATFKQDHSKKEITDMLDAALDAKKITVALKTSFEKDYAGNAAGLKIVLEGMGAYTSVVQQIGEHSKKEIKQYEGKTWQELYEAEKIAEVKASHPDLFKKLYKEEYGVEYAGV